MIFLTSKLSFSKFAIFALKNRITQGNFEKSHIIVKPQVVSRNRKSVFVKPPVVSRKILVILVVFFFSDLVSSSKKSCFLAKIHHKRGFIGQNSSFTHFQKTHQWYFKIDFLTFIRNAPKTRCKLKHLNYSQPS